MRTDPRAALASGVSGGSSRVANADYQQAVTNNLQWTRPGSRSAISTPASGGTRLELTELPPRALQATGAIKSASPDRYGHAANYRWLQGRLEYSASQQQWKLRYIPIDGQTDEFGGSVVLPDLAQVGTFRDGDFVRVEGQLNPLETDSAAFAASYRLQRISALR